MKATSSQEDKISISETAIRQLMRAWQKPQKMGQHPLTQLHSIDIRRKLHNLPDSHISRAKILREFLQEALESLRPDGDKPKDAGPEWLYYEILTKRYLQQRPIYIVMRDLNISERAYYRHLKEGLLKMLVYLNEQELQAREIESRQVADFLIPRKPERSPVGRQDLLETIKNKLFSGGKGASIALYGGPGIGKTTLAMELMHDPEVKSYFKGGILWAGLEHHTTDTEQDRGVEIMEHLRNWGKVLMVKDAQELKTEKLRKILKQEIGTQSVLVVIDNVWDKKSVQDLKVGGNNCTYLITTRSPTIAQWYASDNSIFVQELAVEESEKLVAQLAPEAYSIFPEQISKIVKDVAGVPLLLLLMGSYLKVESQSGQRRHLEDAIHRLMQPKYRLLLSDLDASIERPSGFPNHSSVCLANWIKFSEEMLDDQSRQTLQALSLFPPKPSTFTEEAALAVCEIPTPKTIDALYARGLLESSGQGRYTMHSSISDYARWLLMDMEAQSRIVHSYVRYHVSYIKNYHGLAHKLHPEIKNILAALAMAYEHTLHYEFVEGSNALCWYLDVSGLDAAANLYLQKTWKVADRLGDEELMALTRYNIIQRAIRFGDADFVKECFNQGVASALKSRKISKLRDPRQMQAQMHQEKENLKSLPFDEFRSRTRLINEDKIWRCESALQCARAKHSFYLWTGKEVDRDTVNQGANACIEEALEIAKQLGNKHLIAMVLFEASKLANEQGDVKKAVEVAYQSLEILDSINHKTASDVRRFLKADLGAD